MKIIAFDLGKNFAWANNLDDECNTECIVLSGVERAHRFNHLLKYLLDKHDFLSCFNVMVYETPFVRGRDATRSLWGIAGIIEACATYAGLPVIDVAVPTIKKFAAGHGKASKLEMLAAAKRFGYKGDNEHEADAVCLLRYAESHLERVPVHDRIAAETCSPTIG